jgi:hypothetical protein
MARRERLCTDFRYAIDENSGKGAIYFLKRNGTDWTSTPELLRKFAPSTGKLRFPCLLVCARLTALSNTATTSDYWGLGFSQYSENYQIVGSVYKNNYNGQVLSLTKRVIFPE